MKIILISLLLVSIFLAGTFLLSDASAESWKGKIMTTSAEVYSESEQIDYSYVSYKYSRYRWSVDGVFGFDISNDGTIKGSGTASILPYKEYGQLDTARRQMWKCYSVDNSPTSVTFEVKGNLRNDGTASLYLAPGNPNNLSVTIYCTTAGYHKTVQTIGTPFYFTERIILDLNKGSKGTITTPGPYSTLGKINWVFEITNDGNLPSGNVSPTTTTQPKITQYDYTLSQGQIWEKTLGFHAGSTNSGPIHGWADASGNAASWVSLKHIDFGMVAPDQKADSVSYKIAVPKTQAPGTYTLFWTYGCGKTLECFITQYNLKIIPTKTEIEPPQKQIPTPTPPVVPKEEPIIECPEGYVYLKEHDVCAETAEHREKEKIEKIGELIDTTENFVMNIVGNCQEPVLRYTDSGFSILWEDVEGLTIVHPEKHSTRNLRVDCDASSVSFSTYSRGGVMSVHPITFNSNGIFDTIKSRNSLQDMSVKINGKSVETFSPKSSTLSTPGISFDTLGSGEPQKQTIKISNLSMMPGFLQKTELIVDPTPRQKVPEWIKNNAKWWAEGQIGDSDFVGGIQHLMKEKIIDIPDLPEQSSETAQEQVPDWVRNNAKWWADGQIGEDDFVNGIKWLVEKGIIKV